MSYVRLAILIVSLMAPAVARAADGGIQLYLQPLPADAARLTFTISSISAVSASGSLVPLTLNLKVVGQAEAGRQRLLASDHLPGGAYAGFAFTVGQAALKDKRGDAALLVPDTPVRLDFPFAIAQQQSSLVWLTLKYQESIAGGFGFSPAFVAVTPSKPIADHAGFVTNSGSNTITVFDKNIAQAVAVIDTCAAPAGMVLDQPRRRVYVACSVDDEIQSIDVTTGEIVERTRVSPGDRPTELALTPDGKTLVLVNSGSNSVSFFDAVSLIRQERVNVGSGPASIVIEPAGRRAFVFNTFSSSLSVIDIASRSLAATVSTEAAPLRGEFNRRGDRLFIIHERSPYMTVLDSRQLNQVTRARLKTAVGAIAIDRVRDLVCLGSDNDDAIEFYESHALMPVYSLRVRSGASHLAVDPEDNNLYIVSPDTSSLIVAHLTNRKVATEIDVGRKPYWIAVMGGR